MVTIDKKSRPADANGLSRTSGTKYVFKSASELPRDVIDFVVQSPTPLGQRPIPQTKKSK